jgi:hypothetical protein
LISGPFVATLLLHTACALDQHTTNFMGPLDVFWHISNLFAPAVAMGALAAALTKLLWRRELAGVRWRHLAGPACAACSALVLLGLVVFGSDGQMTTYGAMVLACAATLWWQGFGPGRR